MYKTWATSLLLLSCLLISTTWAIAQNIRPLSGVYGGYTKDFQEIILEVKMEDEQIIGRIMLNHDSNLYFDYQASVTPENGLKGTISQEGNEKGTIEAKMEEAKVLTGVIHLDELNAEHSFYSMPVMRNFPTREEVQQTEMAQAFQRLTDSINGFSAPTPENQLPKTTANWSEESHDFGKITEGEIVAFRFEVTNTGENDLQIVRVKPSCGCTTPQWTEAPIHPGESGFVDIEFNSLGKLGQQHKTVTVISNTEPTQKILTFTGWVNPKE